jgi:hypothetical protein
MVSFRRAEERSLVQDAVGKERKNRERACQHETSVRHQEMDSPP